MGYIPKSRLIYRSKPTQLAIRNSHHDVEMGIFPLLAAAIPAVTGLVGKLVGKKTKSGKPPPEAAEAQNVLDLLTRSIGGDEKKGEKSIKDVIRNIVSTVPSPVLAQVKAGITELRNAQKAGEESRNRSKAQIVTAIDSKFGPQIHALLAGLKAQQLQKQATYEHNKLKSKAEFRRKSARDLAQILQSLNRIEKRLNRAAIVQGSNRIDILGGRGVLER